jgi:hypothetical protein
VIGCSRKPSGDTSTDANNPNAQTASDNGAPQPEERQEPKREREPLVVPAGTTVTVRLGSAIGSKLSQSGDAFTGTVAKDVLVGNRVAIPRGTPVNGTVTDAKSLGKFKGAAELDVRLDSINLNGADLPVRATPQTFTAKGKGKRTAVMTGGGAALGGLIGGLAGGGKGAAIGLAAGAGAGAGVVALAGNQTVELNRKNLESPSALFRR